MTENRRWWEKKWYWVLCILLPFVLGPAINLFFFPEMPLNRSSEGQKEKHKRSEEK